MNCPKTHLLLLLMLNCLFLGAQTVDIENLLKAKPFKFSGSVSADMMYSGTDMQLDNMGQPFQYFLKGSLSATFFGQVTVPLSFSYSNRKFDARYPKNQQNFNRFGIRPKYKWAMVHAGWSNMRFSKYSLNGHSFVGGGVELIPGNFEIKLMHGRLLKAVTPQTSTSGTSNRPVFERWGSGLQVVHKNKGNKYGLSVFRAADDYASIAGGLDSLGKTPEENAVVSLALSQKVNHFITFAVEYASSQVTQDSRAGTETGGFFADQVYLYKNSTTRNYNALKTDMGFRLQKINLGMGYERVDPGYQSHGAYFFNNDFENFTLSFASPFFQDKLKLDTRVGLERDNIGKSKASSANRLVGQANISWDAAEKLQFKANHSNFRNITEFNPYASIPVTNPYDNIDSLRFVQVSQNTSLNMAYSTKTETMGHSLMVMLGMMQTNAELGGVAQNSGAGYYNSNITYNVLYIPKSISASISCNFNQMLGQDQQHGMFGPSLGINTRLFDLVNSGLMYTWNANTGKGQANGNLHRMQFMASTTLKEKHNFNLSATWMNRGIQSPDEEKVRANNFLARLGYSYSF